MVSKQIKRIEPTKDVVDKELYELGEETALRMRYTPEDIDGVNLVGLDHILFLDRQLYGQLKKDIDILVHRIEDLSLHYKDVRDYRDGLLESMEEQSREPDDEISVCLRNHKERTYDCTMCMEPCCPKSEVNNV